MLKPQHPFDQQCDCENLSGIGMQKAVNDVDVPDWLVSVLIVFVATLSLGFWLLIMSLLVRGVLEVWN